MLDCVREGKGTIITDSFHRFEPHGISGFVVIAESPVSIHTWPEFEFAAVDVFTCGDMDIHAMEDYLTKKLQSRVQVKAHEARGTLPQLSNYKSK
jgi:S-adenosylmethionine decarboxylase proenzyme